ncbi:MAG TPA: VOC family protein [Polyangiaceae bacterium]|nr:VOC family protein [Polyangiaceae bacterium]
MAAPTNKNARKIFVNLAVKNMARSKEFFTKLGFEFNPQFTNDQGACMVISDDAFVMLLVEPFFQTFTQKSLCDATKQTEAINALSASSRADVDDLTQKALAAGGTLCQAPQDMGFMYSQSFYDLDGHHWEVVWMDPAAVPQ